VIALRVVLAIVLALATAVVALAQLNLPGKELWQTTGAVAVQWASVSTMSIFILVNEFRIVSHLARAARIRDYDADVRSALSAALFCVVDATGAAWDELAVCYYRPRGVWPRRKLVRMAYVTLGASTSNMPPSVGLGKGVPGEAFQCQEIVAVDWADFMATALEAGRQSWERRSEEARYRLTWGELRRAAQDPGLLATATFSGDGKPDGCILLSGPLKSSDLTTPQMQRILADLAAALEAAGPPPRGWWRAHEL
jgi:hypothetical protein